MKRFLLIMLVLWGFLPMEAQEFRCAVSVNYQKLMTTTQSYESSDKRVFDNLKQALEDFVNSRRWTNLEFEQQERLDCTLTLILSERTSATDFKGQLSIQLRRPVYNSSYTSGMFNYIESGDFGFVYNDSQPLDYDPNTFYGNLSSAVSYYVYIMLGIYFDSYGPTGASPSMRWRAPSARRRRTRATRAGRPPRVRRPVTGSWRTTPTRPMQACIKSIICTTAWDWT